MQRGLVTVSVIVYTPGPLNTCEALKLTDVLFTPLPGSPKFQRLEVILSPGVWVDKLVK